MTTPRARACLVTCTDFRVDVPLASYRVAHRLDAADCLRAGGGALLLARGEPAQRAFMLEQLSLARSLHGVTEVHLINHDDCGHYGPEALADDPDERQAHLRDLGQAAEVVRSALPELTVRTALLRLDP